ncbi:MAG: DJ-1/PfpI family protein [Caldilineaceae bacterium]|nr:DJ-1/PfpI family protein [Caldilineaceae bacterium]
MAKEKKKIAFVVYPGASLLDLVGSYGILLNLTTGPYQLTVVGENAEPMQADTPLQMIPIQTFAHVPQPAMIFVMGGRGDATLEAIRSQPLLDYVRSAAERAEWVGALSTGTLVLAAAGLLTGRRATTHWNYAAHLQQYGAIYVKQRWVEDGKFITGAGGSTGVDMALHLIAKLKGEQDARMAQLFAEYDPEPPFGATELTRGGIL